MPKHVLAYIRASVWISVEFAVIVLLESDLQPVHTLDTLTTVLVN